MADITIWGGRYSDAKGVDLPKTGGGTARFMDTSPTTAIASDVANGKIFFLADGTQSTGTSSGGGTEAGTVTQDANGYLILDDDAPSGRITVESLSVTTNGTYTAPTGKAYSPVTVSVSGGGGDSFKKLIDRSITSVDLPDGLTEIGDYAFAYCEYFDTSSLPSTVTQLGTYAFYNCSRLRSLTSLPSGITSISNSAFEFCGNLALTSLPSSLTSIGANAFRSCEKMTISSIPSGVTTIGGTAFYSCSLVTFSSLPSGITRINSSVFYNCYNITISTIPSGVTIIDASAFTNCESITSISGSGAITTLGIGSFNGSESHPMSITSASFPNMTLSSLSTAFGNSTAAKACQQLEFVDIGSTQTISANAFANCYALKTLVLRRTGSICTLGNVSAFLNTPMRGYNSQTGTIYVPSALISTYQTATNWKTIYDAGTITFSAIEGSAYEL